MALCKDCAHYALCRVKGETVDFPVDDGVCLFFATDNNYGSKWIPVTERLPEAFVSVLAHMPDEKPFPTVRECYVSNDGVWINAYFSMEPNEVTHWMPLPTPPKED